MPGDRARRRLVERTHSWLTRLRRLLVPWEKIAADNAAILPLAGAWITFRAAGLLKRA